MSLIKTFSATAPAQRIVSIDVLRGFALLGILIMNIQSFSMISEAYLNPMAYGDMTGINKWIWILSHVFAAEKFMSIFSMLYGAGILLFIASCSKKGMKPGAMHYRRSFWLLLFGFAHAYLIWYGDILVAYAICGSIAFLFRNKKPRTLIIVAAILFLVPAALSLLTASTISNWPQEQYESNVNNWKPNEEKIAQKVEAMQGSWPEQMDARSKMAQFMQTFLFLWQTSWRALSMMLLGMALFKMRVLSADRSKGFYLRMAGIGLITGVSLSSIGAYTSFAENWSYDYAMFIGLTYNYVGSLGTALGYIGVIMLMMKSTKLEKLKAGLSSVGKLAFSNYILMSLLGMFIFYGNGLGYFGQVERWQQALIVIAIWMVMFTWSGVWLKNFYFGPLEWLWRVLTYAKLQPFKRNKNSKPE